MQAWVRSIESLIAFWNGNPQRAADLAQHGQRYAASGSVGVRLASLEARALAVAGDAQGAVAALVTAEQARDAMQGPDVMPGVFSFPTAKQLTYAGTTHLAIGGPGHVQQAIDCAGTAVDLYRVAAADDRSTFDLLAANLDLARGYMLAGKPMQPRCCSASSWTPGRGSFPPASVIGLKRCPVSWEPRSTVAHHSSPICANAS